VYRHSLPQTRTPLISKPSPSNPICATRQTIAVKISFSLKKLPINALLGHYRVRSPDPVLRESPGVETNPGVHLPMRDQGALWIHGTTT